MLCEARRSLTVLMLEQMTTLSRLNKLPASSLKGGGVVSQELGLKGVGESLALAWETANERLWGSTLGTDCVTCEWWFGP